MISVTGRQYAKIFSSVYLIGLRAMSKHWSSPFSLAATSKVWSGCIWMREGIKEHLVWQSRVWWRAS